MLCCTTLNSQYCTHVFGVLIVGDYAQLIQWDQSGTIVTAPIFFYQWDLVLIDFFTCYDQADRPAQGHDDSVCPANLVEAQKATSTNKSFSVDQHLVVTVPSQDGKSKCSNYIINPPLSQPHTPPGCATHPSIAYDIQRDHIVFFKDSWRVAWDDIMKEGDVVTLL